MKATGIVRRIDDLGRIVIPKEIRRTMRIREGDPLEIYTDREGEVIFKKYSPIGELSHFAASYAETLNRICNVPIVITDRDVVIAVSGAPKREFAEKRISEEAEHIMEQRQTYVKKDEANPVAVVDGQAQIASVIAPILSEGDVIGTVITVCPKEDHRPEEVEMKLAQSAALFLGKQLES